MVIYTSLLVQRLWWTNRNMNEQIFKQVFNNLVMITTGKINDILRIVGKVALWSGAISSWTTHLLELEVLRPIRPTSTANSKSPILICENESIKFLTILRHWFNSHASGVWISVLIGIRLFLFLTPHHEEWILTAHSSKAKVIRVGTSKTSPHFFIQW